MHTYEIVFELIRQRKLDLSGPADAPFPDRTVPRGDGGVGESGKSGAVKVAFEHRLTNACDRYR